MIIINKWWLNHPSINNPFKSSQLKSKKEWQSIKPELFIVTPVDWRDDIQMNDKYGDAEIFGSKGKIPKLYKDAPPGQWIFQTNKAISLFTKHESIRSKSKSKYESRVSKLKEEHFNPKITDIIEGIIIYLLFRANSLPFILSNLKLSIQRLLLSFITPSSYSKISHTKNWIYKNWFNDQQFEARNFR